MNTHASPAGQDVAFSESVAADEPRQFIECLEEEKAAIAGDFHTGGARSRQVSP